MTQIDRLELDRAASIRLLIRWVQTEGGVAGHGSGARLDDIAQAFGLTRSQLNRFLGQALTLEEEAKRADQIAPKLRAILDKKHTLPGPVKRLVAELYGEPGPVLPKDAVVTDPAVLNMRSMMANPDYSTAYVAPLFGLNIILRQSNAYTRTPNGEERRGWSLGLLHMPPEHVQSGRHHPVFRLTQTSKAGNRMAIQGIALARRDRLTLQGIEGQQRRSFTASLALPDGMDEPGFAPDKTPLNGVMLGLSATRANFGGLFDLFKIPNSTLAPDAGETAKLRFDGQHDAALAATGVRNLKETVEALQSLNIKATERHLTHLQARGDDSPLLSLF